jgi:hypothetical protein
MSASDKPFGVPGTEDRTPDDPAALSDEEARRSARNANRFDIRRLIGAVFLLYGLILTALGLFGSHHIKNKAAGINIDLWTGLAMLVFGGLMIFWALARPVARERSKTPAEGSGPIRRAPAT